MNLTKVCDIEWDVDYRTDEQKQQVYDALLTRHNFKFFEVYKWKTEVYI